MTTNFTVDITGTTGMRTGEWADGEEFLILPDTRQRSAQAAARIRLMEQQTWQEADRSPAVTSTPADAAPPTPESASTPPPPAGAALCAAGGTGRATSRPPITVAEVEQRKEEKSGAPHPVLVVHGMDDKVLCTLLPEEAGTPEPGSFRLEDDQGVLLCRITRGRSRLGRRAHWRIHPADGSPVLTGYRGTLLGWAGFLLTFPVWLVFFVGSLLVTLVTFGEVSEMLVWGAPKRVSWRRRFAPPFVGNALDFRYMRTGYQWNPDLLDPRIAYSQAAVHYFTKMHKD